MTMATAVLRPLAKRVVAFFMDKGVPFHIACGLAAQVQGESTFNAKALGDHHHAFGLFQVHDGGRAEAIKKGCSIDLTTLPPFDDQLAAVWWELQHPEAHAWAAIKIAPTAFDAGHEACRAYERPKNHDDWIKRGKFARDWYSALFADFPNAKPTPAYASTWPSAKYA